MFICLCCKKECKIKKNTLSKYCSNKCQRDYEYKARVESWLRGEYLGYTGKTAQIANFVRRYLLETRGEKCESCGWSKRHPVDGAILLEIDHIDGDARNCEPSNLKILCPNCHAMTPTFRARNKISSRIRK
ncbi:hypothetical protein Ro1_00166 [Raoultella phage Ro1]|uniref:HNH nuclease domain-containing protein n=1 Tax=Raoultella phage Ro1 TaxID=2053702 RepID=A0A2H4YGU0_9CAUD|nr:HNH endonuclease [Raoultella phage Ro1]AUE23389.1 hypothetical protein Ro1_00166 [Raoultella phage Ro1]